MTFKEGYRLEKVYFENIYTLLNMLKSVDKNNVDMNTVKELLDNAIADNESIILIYKNLGELYSEVADNYSKLLADLEALKENLESWKDEINEKIDDLNNYIMSLIRDIEQRLDAIEEDLRTMNRNIFLDLNYDSTEQAYYLTDKNGNGVDFEALSEMEEFPHNVIIRCEDNGNTIYLRARDFSDSFADFYAIGLFDSDNTVKEWNLSITDQNVLILTDDTLNNPLYTFGTGLSLDSNNELSVDFDVVQGKLTEGTGIDIDSNNVISVDTTVIQEKLTEGFGIDIDSNNEISVDTTVIQEKLTAGNNIDITNNVISATDTTYSEGTGIDIDSNNVISADTSVLQEKLTAGSGIAIDPVTNEISNTAQGATYSAGVGIDITNNVISEKFPYISANTLPSKTKKFDRMSDYLVEPCIDDVPGNTVYSVVLDLRENLIRFTDEVKYKVMFEWESATPTPDTTDHGLDFYVIVTPHLKVADANPQSPYPYPFIAHSFAPFMVAYGYNSIFGENDVNCINYPQDSYEFTSLNIPVDDVQSAFFITLTGIAVVTKNSQNLSTSAIADYIAKSLVQFSYVKLSIWEVTP